MIADFQDQTGLPEVPFPENVSRLLSSNFKLLFTRDSTRLVSFYLSGCTDNGPLYEKNKDIYCYVCRFTLLLAFTVEVAIQTMAKNVEQFVILFDASKYSSVVPCVSEMTLLSLD